MLLLHGLSLSWGRTLCAFDEEHEVLLAFLLRKGLGMGSQGGQTYEDGKDGEERRVHWVHLIKRRKNAIRQSWLGPFEVSMSLFVGGDFVDVHESQADVIETMEEAVTSEGFNFEGEAKSILIADLAGFQIDGEGVAILSVVFGEDQVDLFLGEADWEGAILEAVVVEDIGEGGGDDCADTEVFDGPDGMFAAGSISEIATGHQD